MSSCLFNDAISCIHQDDHQLCIGSSRNHIAGILNMAGGIRNDEFSSGRTEIFISDVDGDSLFSFSAQAIGEQCQIYTSFLFIPALSFQSLQLVTQYAFTIVQESADQSTLSVIHTACCYKS